ncbi:hypothetical protein [Staphylococcus chromogenes]|uniref:hypothetical protein n=1 Tax=Staphylococcus chromogenes TaxID=46126 RepID=UPI0018E54C31|nr:hypothetical protein [Staphylococcus chromogenes]
MAKDNDIIDPILASIMITSGAMTVLLFPLSAKDILKNPLLPIYRGSLKRYYSKE